MVALNYVQRTNFALPLQKTPTRPCCLLVSCLRRAYVSGVPCNVQHQLVFGRCRGCPFGLIMVSGICNITWQINVFVAWFHREITGSD